jgi:bacterioferritin-associated ferredoxin
MHKDKKDTIICRCQDITLGEVEAALDAGITDPEELKRFLHIGMGPCQGRTCGRLVLRLIAKKTGKPIHKIHSTTERPPLVSVPIREFLGEENE